MVAGHDNNVRVMLKARSQRADAIIGFVAFDADIGYAKACNDLFDKIELRDQILGRGRPIRFVTVVMYPSTGILCSS
jgi:hypothetical protein